MISAYRDMFAAHVIALLSLVAVSHSDPLACKDAVRPLQLPDPHVLEGKWTVVAGSLKVADADNPAIYDSVSIDFYNSTYIQASRSGDMCRYHSQNISIEGHNFNFRVGQVHTFNGTFYHTSCPDCVVLKMAVDSPNFKSVEVYLLSKRREVDEKEMDEFITQVECLNMPKHFVMDPAKGLCPDQSTVSS